MLRDGGSDNSDSHMGLSLSGVVPLATQQATSQRAVNTSLDLRLQTGDRSALSRNSPEEVYLLVLLIL